MSAQPPYFKVGLFVLVATALLLLLVSLLGAGSLFKRVVVLETYFNETVEGLSEGSAVKYLGVQIGSVSHIDFVVRHYPSTERDFSTGPGRWIRVAMEVDRRHFGEASDQEIREHYQQLKEAGMRVQLASSGLAGPKYLEFAFVDPLRYPVPELAWEPDALYVPAVPGRLDQIADSVRDILDQVREANIGGILRDADHLLKNLGGRVDQVGQAMDHFGGQVGSFVGDLKETRQRVQQVIEHPGLESMITDLASLIADVRRNLPDQQLHGLGSLATELPAASARLHSTLKRLDELLNDPQVAEQARQLTRLLSSTAEGAPQVLENLQSLLQRLDSVVETERGELHQALRTLQEVLQAAEELLEEVRANPARLLLSQPPARSTLEK